MTEGLKSRAIGIARELARELSSEGARAAIVTGSWARGDAHRESDIDLRVVGDGPDKKLLRRDGFLVSIGWMEEEEHRAGLDDPEEVASVVPGWRSAEIVHDPEGIAAAIKAEAEAWEWARVEERCDGYVATSITRYAEELQSLATDVDLGLRPAAAAQCSMLATGIAPVMAVHRRILYETEKRLWDEVGAAMGDQWQAAQAAALGQKDEPFREMCAGAYRLFDLAADGTYALLDEQQRAVVDHARRFAAGFFGG
ncbi:MAG TPA: nucleotidyltransferase domain-containing protein [Actinomycetota bacterium]|nr:nucleotidyltransferase domain-containing protein [Actinomycetota bacterium]